MPHGKCVTNWRIFSLVIKCVINRIVGLNSISILAITKLFLAKVLSFHLSTSSNKSEIEYFLAC